MNILLTGGLGYIGSHTAIELLANKNNLCIIDNLSNSNLSTSDKIKKISGKNFSFVQGDIRDEHLLKTTLISNKIQAVIHFAGSKYVDESMKIPINYYDNNINGTISLLKAMNDSNVRTLIFSSSASVYGVSQYNPIDENHILNPVSTYAKTKKHIEEMIFDVYASDNRWKFVLLRYFNPVGAHKSGLIGETINGRPSNLMPYISKVASGSLPYLLIYGNDYPTKDGTGIRDYIHVEDLAQGHLAALNYASNKKISEPVIFNLGTGKGTSVLEMIAAFESVTGKKIPYKMRSRRNGDIACSFADSTKAKKFLNWSAKKSLKDMCETSWKFEIDNK